jgi:ABC-type transport system substrate-binding protein
VRHKLLICVLTVGLAVALLVTAASAIPSNESNRGGTLRVMWGQEPDSLDPALANGDIGSWALLGLTCARLFDASRDPDSGQVRFVPEVVRTYDVSNAGRTYTFELKRTFRFHTGERVTAHSFVAAFNRDALMRSAAATRGYMHEIVGADAVVEGRARRISGVRTLGPYRLRIRLKRRAGDFVARLTMPYFCPISLGTPEVRIDDPPGSGPYWLADRAPGRQLVLERNRYYRGGRTANPNRIVWTIEPDRTARLRATEEGSNDWVLLFNMPDTIVRDLVEAYGLNRPGDRVLRLLPTFSALKLVFRFNPDRPAFEGAGQIPLKKAINYALDRPALTRARGYLQARPSDGLLPLALSRNRRLYPLRGADPVTARRWLARAQVRPTTLTLYTPNFEWAVAIAQVFVYNLKQLGIEVDMKQFDFQTWLEKLRTPGEPWDVSVGGGGAIVAPYPDPAAAFLQVLRGTRWEARVEAANQLTDPAARAKAWADLETDLMRDDPPVAAYGDWNPPFFVSRSFGCWRPGQELDFAAICKK